MSDLHAISVKHAAALYDVGEDAIRGAINRRELPAKRIGRNLRIETAALREWFDRLADASPEAVEE